MPYRELIQSGRKIILAVVDGLGGLPVLGGFTEMELAHLPNLDMLARRYPVGALEPVAAGITPGSGPAHLALFGYDPLKYRIGRGILEALGVDMEVRRGDLAIRGNFATVRDGVVVDRRAGRIPTEENRRLIERLKAIDEVKGVRVIWKSGKEHRFVLLLRGEGLSPEVAETDPGKEGLPPREPEPLSPTPQARFTAEVLREIVERASQLLKDEPQANFFLLRGYAMLPDMPTFEEKWGLKAFGVASYPMYRGLAKLVGMTVPSDTPDFESEIEALRRNWNDYDFFYIHFKDADKAGEDGDWRKKVAALERFDSYVPRLLELGGVLAITGDHDTPCLIRGHSWHYVPLVIASERAGVPTAWHFTERESLTGALGLRPSTDLMGLLLASAGRLKKFGA
ncbi:MAG: 2,3-bisphosphoglycerate-independent phosphoglycerate mutase [Thermotogae bacterium]|nr:2,3-bisphosphoglycerate-independent phosphoglycerate mutase [Thermotogota bacterium]